MHPTAVTTFNQAPTKQFKCSDTPPSLSTTEMVCKKPNFHTVHKQPHLSHGGLFSASYKFASSCGWVDRHANKQTHGFEQNDFNKQGVHPHNPAPSLKILQRICCYSSNNTWLQGMEE